MSASTAHLLVVHGSRDTRPQTSLKLLVRQIRPEIPWIKAASLSFQAQPFTEQLIQAAHKADVQGYQRLKILPLFLLPGIHVNHDIPRAIAQVQSTLPGTLRLELRPHLGAHPGILPLLLQQFNTLSAPHRILLSHGTRFPTGNMAIAQLGKQLQAHVAYWSTPPSLEQQINASLRAGHHQIAILPYLLFSGSLNDTIAQKITTLAASLQPRCSESIELQYGQPLQTSPNLVRLITRILKT